MNQKPRSVKKVLLITTFSLFLLGCNMNPSKEARIQKLESEIKNAIDKIETLEGRIHNLEEINRELNLRILDLEEL